MLKFGYGIVLDGLPDIPEFHFFLGSGRPQTRFSTNVLFIFQKSLNVWKSQACRNSPHGPIKKEMCHLKAEKNKLNHSGCLLSQILFHCFVCLYVFSFYSIIPLCPYYVQLFYPFRVKFIKIAVHAHMNDLSIINLVLS